MRKDQGMRRYRDLGGLGEAESCREEVTGPLGMPAASIPRAGMLTISVMAALEC